VLHLGGFLGRGGGTAAACLELLLTLRGKNKVLRAQPEGCLGTAGRIFLVKLGTPDVAGAIRYPLAT